MRACSVVGCLVITRATTLSEMGHEGTDQKVSMWETDGGVAFPGGGMLLTGRCVPLAREAWHLLGSGSNGWR